MAEVGPPPPITHSARDCLAGSGSDERRAAWSDVPAAVEEGVVEVLLGIWVSLRSARE